MGTPGGRTRAVLLMWDIRRKLQHMASLKVNRRSVIHFQYADAPQGHRVFWLIAIPDGDIDLCEIDPGFDVDLYVSCSFRSHVAKIEPIFRLNVGHWLRFRACLRALQPCRL